MGEKNAPARIWATVNGWSQDHERPGVTEYVRADIADKMVDALEVIRDLSGFDHSIFGASATVMSRMADIHQHADAALSRHGEGK